MAFWEYEWTGEISRAHVLHYKPKFLVKYLTWEKVSSKKKKKSFGVVWLRSFQDLLLIFHVPLLARFSHDFNFAYQSVLATHWGSHQFKTDLSFTWNSNKTILANYENTENNTLMNCFLKNLRVHSTAHQGARNSRLVGFLILSTLHSPFMSLFDLNKKNTCSRAIRVLIPWQ